MRSARAPYIDRFTARALDSDRTGLNERRKSAKCWRNYEMAIPSIAIVDNAAWSTLYATPRTRPLFRKATAFPQTCRWNDGKSGDGRASAVTWIWVRRVYGLMQGYTSLPCNLRDRVIVASTRTVIINTRIIMFMNNYGEYLRLS